MDVIDPVGECLDELHRVHHLPVQMAGVEVESELRAVVKGRQSTFGSDDIKGDLCGMDLKSELHTAFGKDIQNGVEGVGKVFESVSDGLFGNRGAGLQ